MGHYHYHIRFGTFEQDPLFGVEWGELDNTPFTSRKAAATMAAQIARCNETWEIVRVKAVGCGA